MDDIAGLNFSSNPTNGSRTAPSNANYSAFNALKPTPTPPLSGRASPFSAVTSQPASKPSTPGNDSFANLVPFTAPSSRNLSLLEQQRKQTEARLGGQSVQSRGTSAQYAGINDDVWNNLGSGRATPANGNVKTQRNGADDEDDLFAAFNKPATTQTSTKPSSRPTPALEDDDPFGLSEAGPRRTDTAATAETLDDDDVLGLLGKPATARPRPASPPPLAQETPSNLHPQDKAVAELVDMGFPADKAKVALGATDSGLDVQAAVGILLNQAHAEARQKTQSRNVNRQAQESEEPRRPPRGDVLPSRSRRQDGDGSQNRLNARTGQEKDFEQMASEFGANFLKSANSLWKQGTRKVQQAVQEFNSDSEGGGGQPKWMQAPERPARKEARSAPQDAEPVPARRRRSPPASAQPDIITDEAMMLESSRPTPPPRPSQRPDRRFDAGADSPRDHSPAVPSRLRESASSAQPAFMREATKSPPTQPAFVRQQNQQLAATSRSSLSKAATEEQAAQAYVSSARRRKPQPAPSVDPDLMEGGFRDTSAPARPTAPSIASKPASLPRTSQSPGARVSTPPIQVRPPAPSRTIPTISPIVLKASNTARTQGNEHFKRGDYASAHASYSTSLSHLPTTHPLTIILLTNRALTGLKTGEPKSAIVDADRALTLIGPSKGENENLAVDDSEKPMREYYGKALMRKAEALEQMEKWADAALVWREAVEGGHGGATSIQGRSRAEKAANPQKTKPAPPRKTASAPPATTRRHPALTSQKPAEAVSRLRLANQAAEAADDEKFALSDSVDARIHAWKNGKQDNLRALLSSLETVLGEGSGWKKISMADLILPGKVKVNYMKGIARVHPDKVRCNCFWG
jgi:hypothetical protein